MHALTARLYPAAHRPPKCVNKAGKMLLQATRAGEAPCENLPIDQRSMRECGQAGSRMANESGDSHWI
eukprot:1714297-Pleurochrysis_carterae.AAC.3